MALRHRITPRVLRGLLIAALVVEAVVMAWLVLNPSPAVPLQGGAVGISNAMSNHGVPDLFADTDVVEFVCNVALFVPMGATLALLVPRVPWWAWLGVGFVLSGAVELFQWGFLDGRSASWRDVWSNTIGLALGAALVAAAEHGVRRFRKGRRASVATL